MKAPPTVTKPNIIWIMADDLGYGDLGSYGCTDFPTPHIDAIASNGVRATRFYAAAPTCSPSRAAILTGRFPDTLGIGGALMGKGGLTGDKTTIAKVLKEAGYTTGLVGKWHLGYADDRLPNPHGFDEFYGHRGGKIDFFTYTDTAQKVADNPMGKHDFFENDQVIYPEGYATDLFTDRAIRFVETHKGNPFFLFLSYNAPHYARPGVLQAPEEYVRRFTKGDEPTRRELYAAMVSCMDDGIGKFMDHLRENGLIENSVVIFLSDNGGDPSNGGSNKPFLGAKWKWDEGGIRVPMMAQWPGKIPAGTTTDQALHMVDFFPTMLAMAGVPMPEGMEIDGLDINATLKNNAPLPERPLFFQKAVMQGKWKLLNGTRLFDMDNDPTERNDLAAQHPEVVETLQALHAAR